MTISSQVIRRAALAVRQLAVVFFLILGVVSSSVLVTEVHAQGSGASFTSLSVSNYAPIHGQQTTFSSAVTSGTGGPTPTGSVSFLTTSGTTLATVGLVNGNASYTTNTLAGGTYTVYAAYTGDTVYSGSQSPTPYAQVLIQPETSSLNVTIAGSTVIGGTVNVVVTDTAASGVGLPSGIVTVMLPASGATYPGTLVPVSAHSASVTIPIPATTVGTITASVNCTTNADFTCYNPATTTFTVLKATPSLSISYSPNPPVSGGTIQLNATVSAVGTAPPPTGNVRFFDNGTVLNAGALSNGNTTTTGVVPSTTTHTITATYDGDPDYNSISTSAGSTTSGSIATTTALNASATTVTAGQPIIFTATVSPTVATSTVPSGLVQFYDGSTQIGTAGLNGTTATFNTSQLSASASHSITAIYVGDTNFTGSTSAPVVVGKSTGPITTTTALNASATVANGQTITFTATITPASTGTSAPSGTVQFFDGTTQIGSAMVVNNVAIFPTATLAASTSHTITATYVGDTIYSGSTSNGVPIAKSTTGGTATATALSVGSTTAVYGTSVTLSATVTPTVNSTPLSGSVQFTSGGVVLCAANLSASTASCSVATLPVGKDNIVAAYLGDTNYAASTSPATSITITSNGTQATSTTALSISPTTATFGTAITLSATVAASSGATTPVPTGSVEFLSSVGGAVLCTAVLTNGTGSCQVATLPIGTSTVTAFYESDQNYLVSTSNPSSVTISSPNAVPATLTANFVPNVPVLPGAVADITAVVTAPSGTVPAGSVTATITGGNGVVYATAVSGTTNISTVVIPITAPATVGTYSVVVSCSGTNFTCAPVTLALVVSATAKIGTSTVLTVAAGTASASSEVLTATVTAQSTGTSALTGTVSFYDGTTLLGTGTVSSGVATATVTLTGTTHSLTAVYSGDNLYASSTSAIVTVASTVVPATISLTSNVSTSLSGINVILTAVVSGTTTGTTATVPTGKVSFYDTYNGTTSLLGSSMLTASGVSFSTAALSTTGLKPGTHVIYAVYGGDSNFQTATSNNITLGQTDYNIGFNPANLTLTRGTSGTVLLSVASVGGFQGSVKFSCTPPPNAEFGCIFSPSTVAMGGTTTLTISTTLPHAKAGQQATLDRRSASGLAAGVVCAGLFCWFFPGRRRRLSALLMAMMAVLLLSNAGCTNGNFPQTPNPTTPTVTDSGTPIGTAVLTINTVGTDGVNEIAHTYYYQVTVQ